MHNSFKMIQNSFCIRIIFLLNAVHDMIKGRRTGKKFGLKFRHNMNV